MLGAAFGMGFVLGPALGGILGSYNPRLPFWVAGGLSLVNGMYGLFVLPESLKEENRSRFSWKRANPVGSVWLLGRNKVLLGMAAVLVLGYLAQQSLMNVYVIYCDYRYHWSDRTVGISLAVVGMFSGLYGALLVKRIVGWVGERKAMAFGLLCGAIGWVMMGASSKGLLMWGAIPVLNLMAIVWPSAQSIMSREVGPDRQGQLQGAVNSLRGIAGMIGPGLFTYIYSLTLNIAPGAAFFTAAGILLVSLGVSELVRPSELPVRAA
jgi:DHA1 family tetracycline resistance protein-like MFS transporter